MTAKTAAKYPSEVPHAGVRSVLQIPLFLLDTLRASSFALFLIYVVLAFLRPLDTFWPELLDARPMMTTWALAFVAGVLNALHRRRVGAMPIHFGLLFIFILIIMLSMVANGWAGGAFQAAGDFSASAMIFVVAALNLTSIKRIRITCVTLVIAMMAAVTLSLYAYYTGFEWKTFVLKQARQDIDGFKGEEPFGFIPADDTSGLYMWRIRGASFLSDPNDFAQMIVATLPMLWIYAGVMSGARRGTALSAVQRLFASLIDRVAGLRQLIFAGLPAALLLFGIYMTQSRGAMLGVASLMAFSVHQKLGNLKTGLLIGMGLLGVLAINVGGRAMSMKESSADDRIGAWGSAMQMFKSHPILGVGYNNFLEHHHLTAHNSFVLCFAELGLLGFAPWVALLVLSYLSLKQVIDNRPKHDEHRRIAILLRSSLLGYMTCAWFLSRSYSTGLFFMLALCCAVSVSLRYQLVDDARAAKRAGRDGASNDGSPPPTPTDSAAMATSASTVGVARAGELAFVQSTHPLAKAAQANELRRVAAMAAVAKERMFGRIPAAQWMRWTAIVMAVTIVVVQLFVMIGRRGG